MSRWVVVAVALAAACAKKTAATHDEPAPVATDAASTTTAPTTPKPFPPADAAAAAGPADAGVAPAATGPVPGDAKLLVTSVAADWDTIATELTEYRRNAAGGWDKVRRWSGVLGNTGLAWGKGLHGNGPPAGQDGPMKIEGDGKSPAGVFTLDGSYGYGSGPPPHAALPYTQVDKSWHCVDDGDSQSYNKIVDADQVTVDWKSAEDMRRKDVLYTWVIAVGHNPERMPGEGSCIFLHVWRSAKDGTVGCTAMPKGDIEALLSDLDPADKPVLVQLTAPIYAAVADAWKLPAR